MVSGRLIALRVTDYSPPIDPLDIVYLDHELLAVNKPSGLLSVPGRGPLLADCLITRIQADYPSALLVHRLDRDTSGVMVFALSAHAQRHLGFSLKNVNLRRPMLLGLWARLNVMKELLTCP